MFEINEYREEEWKEKEHSIKRDKNREGQRDRQRTAENKEVQGERVSSVGLGHFQKWNGRKGTFSENRSKQFTAGRQR